MNKIAIFVDVQNIYYTTRDMHKRSFNYKKFMERIKQQGIIVCAYAYAIDRGDDRQIKFQDALRNLGFTVKLKPFIQRRDGSAKGDWDVGITIDIMEAANEVDTIILLSGDGDFDLLMNKVRQSDGARTEVYGVPMLTANSLIRSVDKFHEIDLELLL